MYKTELDLDNSPLKEMGLTLRITEHLAFAKTGNMDRERRLIQRLGELRSCNKPFSQLCDDLQKAVKDAVMFLRSTGREVNFTHPNAAMWITTRDGRPRW
jgi:hypothetical protein